MKQPIILALAKDFTRTPGGRYRIMHEHPGSSAEEFLRDHLKPCLERALRNQVPLVVNFDGIAGVAASFLAEAFGGLVEGRPALSIEPRPLEHVKRVLKIVSTEDEYLEGEVWEDLENAEQRRLKKDEQNRALLREFIELDPDEAEARKHELPKRLVSWARQNDPDHDWNTGDVLFAGTAGAYLLVDTVSELTSSDT